MEENVKVPINPSIPSGELTVWADVSSLLDSACRDLKDGELVHGENFNLFAAMSALEIMDPKMDSGMVFKYYSVDEAIENGAAPVPLSPNRTVDVQCIIDIIDHLLACEATWHKGHSLAQTVFSCIYLLRPDRTSSHALLHSYCGVMRATCNAVVSTVSDARTHEEEDLFAMTYGLPLQGKGDEKSLAMLHAVEETICRQLRACKAPSLKKRAVEDIEPLQTNPDLEEGFCIALLCRIRFRKHFFHILTSMRRPQGRGLMLARKHISSCLSELDSILKTSDFLRSNVCGACIDGLQNKTTASGCQPIGFDASLNCRLSAPTPPRAISILSWMKAVEYFKKLLYDLDIICSYPLEPLLEGVLRFVAVEYFKKLLYDLDIICSYPLEPLLEGVLRFVVEFQKNKPDLIARAHLQLLLVQDGKLYGRDSLFSVISKAAAFPDVLKNHDIQNNEVFVQLGQLVLTLLKILCTNAAWQRRKLGKFLQDWQVIFIQLQLAFRKEYGDISCIPIDENLCTKMSKHILVWVEELTYWIASRFLMLGFELELYSPGEYCMVYWYIYIVLIKLAEKTHLKLLANNDTTKRKAKKKRDSLKDLGTDYQIPSAVLLLQCQIYLAEGLTMMLAALRNEGKLSQSSGPFNTDHERFMQHFELLQKASIPDHLSYLSFQESTVQVRFSNLVSHNYFKDAHKIAKELRSSFSHDPEKVAELRRFEQVAEHNCIALNLICKLGNVEPSLKVYFEFSHHPCFATAVVKRS